MMRESVFENAILGDACCSDTIGATDREWIKRAVSLIEADFHRSADTHLLKFPIASLPGIDIYLKDESTHPTGSLKHRLARSLFLYGLCNGKIGPETLIVEASSGSTAISEAYFARLLGLELVAVVPESTSPAKIAEIEHFGGRCEFAPGSAIYDHAEAIARAHGGYYMDQFTFAERATDWRGNNNIAKSLFQQMDREPNPAPSWIVVGAGTGGTSATIGRFIRYRPEQYGNTQLCVADPEGSVFFNGFEEPGSVPPECGPSRLEGVGRPRLEPSFIPSVVDRMIRVSDAASIATTHWLSQKLGRRVGGSTGLNMFATLALAEEMVANGQSGSLVTLICDSGARYDSTIFNHDWLKAEGIDLSPVLRFLGRYD
ncbi:PLP-dependent cysteine synthase family protein [Alterisphingorhabdus coralli]|uniref:L-cysteine desulfhydrase Cds1 n=1 Tax=Alterisphingorhabdus coralli TaxID=3071408 RepID=A0AA97F7A6_9SPHN|nr:PLP-dependent cysteine synthase family protein [Parasphingorhabdus sp. SCSIO 66989]WOE75506.1 PLP-dependent cysteine synthase family protein [Parasphingorhabdus sp. SCSIO 66989]